MNDFPLAHANIIQLLGIASLPLDERMEIVQSAVELVETRTMGRAMEKLNADQQKELAAAFEAEDEGAVADILSKNSIDLLALTEEEAERVKRELLEVAETAGEE